MNKLKLFVVLLLLCVSLPEASAQVSVRRGGARREASAPRKDQKEKKKDKEKKDPRNAALITSGRQNGSEPDVMSDPSASAPVREAAVPTRRPDVAAPGHDAPAATPTRRTTPRRPSGQASSALADGVTQRQQSFAEYQRQDDSYVPWQHVVYRELDLTREVNASLYYPVEPQDGLTNLFRVILDGLCTGRLRGYEFLDGREVFTDRYEIKVQDILDKFQILYTTRPGVGQNAKTQYVVEEMDVPCNEVLSYYIKERWEFNQRTSMYGPRILALCPVLHRSGDFGGEAVPYPVCWINYEDLRPLLRDHLVMSSGMNNTPRFTMEEFFTLEQYEGDIYKVQNVRGLSLVQQYPDPDTLRLKRAEIEAQLRGFGDSIWVHEPTEADLAAQDSLRAARRAERRARRGAEANASVATDGKVNRRTKQAVDVEAAAEAREAQEDEIDQRVEQTGTAHSARRSARRR